MIRRQQPPFQCGNRPVGELSAGFAGFFASAAAATDAISADTPTSSSSIIFSLFVLQKVQVMAVPTIGAAAITVSTFPNRARLAIPTGTCPASSTAQATIGRHSHQIPSLPPALPHRVLSSVFPSASSSLSFHHQCSLQHGQLLVLLLMIL